MIAAVAMLTPEGRRKRRLAARLRRLLLRERELWASGHARIAGADEVGMGPLAGPVVAAAVVFPEGLGLAGVDDSKRLTAEKRVELDAEIRASALAYSVSVVESPDVDSLNVYRAGLEALRRAIVGLSVVPDFVLTDARKIPGLELPQEAIVKGDATCHAIAAASILAKCARDALMRDYDARYPGYGFAEHKGYATAEHRAAIRKLGPSPIHRRSFLLLPHPRLFD